MSEATAGAVGELELLRRIRGWLGPACPPAPEGMGDDCAVVRLPAQQTSLLLTTDPVVEGRHFTPDTPARLVGAKLLNRNLSDIAAMGGEPLAAVVSLAVPPATPLRWLEAFHTGLRSAALRHRTPINGGDITATPGPFSAHLTLVGLAAGHGPLRRDGAGAGCALHVTGRLGGSLLGRHLRFEPRLDIGRWLAARGDVAAATDLSDGLAKDLRPLVQPGHAAWIDERAIPVSQAAHRLARRDGRSALEHALTDGEDYELLFATHPRTDPRKFVAAFRRRFPGVALSTIGRIALEPGAPGGAIRSASGGVAWDSLHGHEHLRPPA